MAELNSSAVASFIDAVTNGAEEAASSFARTFGKNIKIETAQGGAFQFDQFSDSLSEPGLILVLQVGGKAIAVLLASSSGLIPDWCNAPDATGRSKLSTFAQEWGMNLAPEDFFPEDFKAGMVQNLSAGVMRAMPELDAGYLELKLIGDTGSISPAFIVWALTMPDELLNDPKPEADEQSFAMPSFGAAPDAAFAAPSFGTPAFGGVPTFNAAPNRKRIEDLPGYSRSMLKVKIPVGAVLARARKPIKTVLELGVGSVIQFDKSCEDLLEVEAGQSIVIATAEAVKVGEKFGFRISTLLLPEERFRKVEIRREGEYRAKKDSPQIIGKAPIRSF